MSQHRTARRLGLVRFLTGVLMCTVIFTFAPTIAQASFTARATAQTTVSTYRIPAPVGVTASATCPSFSGLMNVNVADFGAVGRATSYTVSLTRQGTTTEVAPSQELKGTRSASFTVSRSLLSYPTYTLRIRANVGLWTGETLVRDVSC